MLFIPITVCAAAFQVARNALQRGLVGDAGPWGATLVRFLFGLPFSLVFLAVAWTLAPVTPQFTATFWAAAAVGAFAQIAATGALLSAMHRSGFALGAGASSQPRKHLVQYRLLPRRADALASCVGARQAA